MKRDREIPVRDIIGGVALARRAHKESHVKATVTGTKRASETHP
jgi:hypothetical protein